MEENTSNAEGVATHISVRIVESAPNGVRAESDGMMIGMKA